MSESTYYQQFGINQSVFNSEPAKQLTPILKDPRSASDDFMVRKDCYGNIIKQGSKKHKISFGEKNQVFLVENWKEYNVDMASQESPCVCNLI